MATLLVVNHGSNHSRETPDYVLADFSKANENNGGVLLIDTPGFGSTAFNTKWADKERSSTKKGSFSLVQAKWYMEFVADKWFKDALVSVANTRPDVKTWAEIKKIVFVGWSRGCITTWYQIFYLQQYNKIFNYYRPKICIFNIEPCYGPSNWKSDIRAGMRYIGSGDILEEAYAVNESGMKILPGVFALYPYNQGICKRYFLPGKHSTGTIRSDESYGKNTISLYTQRLRDFLTANAPEIKLTGLPTTGGKRMDLYTEFKTSYMNRGELKYRFNRGQRMAIWPYNNAQKNIENTFNSIAFLLSVNLYFAESSMCIFRADLIFRSN